MEEFHRSMDVAINDQNAIKSGDIFFIHGIDLSSYVAYENTDMTNYYIGQDNFPSDIEVDKDVMFALKYVGSGIFEEMLTHQKILAPRSTIHFSSGTEKYLPDYGRQHDVDDSICYNTFLSDDKRNLDDFLKNAERIKNEMVNYPVTISNSGILFSNNDQTKKDYIKNTDEERKEYMKKILIYSKEDVKKAITVIDHQISLASNLSKEKLDIAYLENQLYDFQNEEKKTR